jgi:hypothetical protein
VRLATANSVSFSAQNLVDVNQFSRADLDRFQFAACDEPLDSLFASAPAISHNFWLEQHREDFSGCPRLSLFVHVPITRDLGPQRQDVCSSRWGAASFGPILGLK